MKKTPLLLLLVAVTSLLSAFAYDILKQLELTEKEANEYIFNNIHHGSLNFPKTEVIKSVAIGDRAATVKQLGDYMRKYTESAEFNEAYQEARAAAMPQGRSTDIKTLMSERVTGLEREIASTEENMKKASSDMKKLYEFTLSELKKEHKALTNPKDPNHAFYKSNLEEMEAEKEEENNTQSEAQRKMTEEQFPANPKVLIKKRLQEFLVLTADIDFNAKLVERGDVMKFADPKLEAKSSMWKRCFRSGKETVSAARNYAQQWLKDLK